jgi:orotate phosphoribosyltransferase
MTMSQRLLQLLPIRRGHFLLESGNHGDIWLDLKALFSRPVELRPVVDELAQRIAAYNVEGVCGPFVGGAILAQMIAETLDLEFYFIERLASSDGSAATYQLPDSLRAIVANQSVAVVDDAIHAGSAVGSTLAELSAASAKPIVVGALLIVGTAADSLLAAQKVPLEHIARLSGELWPPAECPLCAAGVPLETLEIR